ncbi:MAG: DivIVA domain-containing protein [Nakamurella sp.]
MTSPLPAVPPRVSRLHRGYSVAAVDTLVQRVNAVLSGDPTAEPITPDELRTVVFPAERGGYQETAVDAVIDQLIALLPSASASPRATPAAGVDPLLAHVPEKYRNPSFSTTAVRSGYDLGEVDALIDRLNAAFALTDIRDRAAVGRILEGLRSTTLHAFSF